MELLLKSATAEDYDEYYKIRCSPADIFWNGYTGKPDKESFRQLFLQRLGNNPLSEVEDRRIYLIKVNENYIGFLQLIKREDGIDIGYTVIEEFQRRGYATLALHQGIKLAKEYDNRIYVQIRDDNIPSQCVACKCGLIKTEEYTFNNYPNVGKVKLRKYRLLSNFK